MLSALTLVLALLGLAGLRVKRRSARTAAPVDDLDPDERARQLAAEHEARATAHEHSAFARWGGW